ncbi:hypothetical protein P171DRAFT_474983 [Karstenula rhodostoma CBS 690.94]|uniref:Uncharacterized protein n=1 Tax=Karstenula rhodostoma CBS 690.94 TaxID=1392251 RepID=A0A9P4PEF4_9PLEO|nr:hypothetical protein P171DRAFT_474983 [Karstenula rhodostoma CBS 690.94]
MVPASDPRNVRENVISPYFVLQKLSAIGFVAAPCSCTKYSNSQARSFGYPLGAVNNVALASLACRSDAAAWQWGRKLSPSMAHVTCINLTRQLFSTPIMPRELRHATERRVWDERVLKERVPSPDFTSIKPHPSTTIILPQTTLPIHTTFATINPSSRTSQYTSSKHNRTQIIHNTINLKYATMGCNIFSRKSGVAGIPWGEAPRKVSTTQTGRTSVSASRGRTSLSVPNRETRSRSRPASMDVVGNRGASIGGGGH